MGNHCLMSGNIRKTRLQRKNVFYDSDIDIDIDIELMNLMRVIMGYMNTCVVINIYFKKVEILGDNTSKKKLSL